MEINISDNEMMIKDTERGKCYIQMEMSMLDSEKMEKNMEKDSIITEKIIISTMGNGMKIKNKDLENELGWMEVNILENGRMIFLMVRVN